jgi:hypothetical protein
MFAVVAVMWGQGTTTNERPSSVENRQTAAKSRARERMGRPDHLPGTEAIGPFSLALASPSQKASIRKDGARPPSFLLAKNLPIGLIARGRAGRQYRRGRITAGGGRSEIEGQGVTRSFTFAEDLPLAIRPMSP